MNFVVFFVLSSGEFLLGKRHTGAVYGRSKVHDDGVVGHCGEGKDIINGCTDGFKKRYCFTIAVLMRVSDSQYQES